MSYVKEATGWVQFRFEPPGVDIMIDRVPVSNNKNFSLPPGWHPYEVSSPGYQTLKGQAQVFVNKVTTLDGNLDGAGSVTESPTYTTISSAK